MTEEELALQKTMLLRQATRSLRIFSKNLKLHTMLIPVIEELLHGVPDGPDGPSLQSEELIDVLDSIPRAAQLFVNTTFATPL